MRREENLSVSFLFSISVTLGLCPLDVCCIRLESMAKAKHYCVISLEIRRVWASPTADGTGFDNGIYQRRNHPTDSDKECQRYVEKAIGVDDGNSKHTLATRAAAPN